MPFFVTSKQTLLATGQVLSVGSQCYVPIFDGYVCFSVGRSGSRTSGDMDLHRHMLVVA